MFPSKYDSYSKPLKKLPVFMEHNVHRSLPLEPVLKQVKLLHTFTLYYVNIKFKITSQPTYMSSEQHLPCGEHTGCFTTRT